jgi:hypothetical protein
VTPAPSGLISPPLSARNADGFLDAETWKPVPASAGVTPALSGLISPPLSARNAQEWMRRFGTGTGFAARSCPRSFHFSERSLASVRMTELGLVLLSTKKIRCGVELPTGGDVGVACSGGLGAVASLY